MNAKVGTNGFGRVGRGLLRNASTYGPLSQERYRVIGPRLRDNAIVLDEVTGVADLPSGWGVDVSLGTGLSDAVAQALPGLVDRVLGELDLDQARRDRLRWAAS